MIKNIYLDMDGVLCDFNKHYTNLFGMHPKQARDQKNGNYSSFWNTFVDNGEFVNIPPLEGYDKILHAVAEYRRQMKGEVTIRILTSSGGQSKYAEVAAQKTQWLKDHFIIYEPIVVPGRRYKQEYANPYSILIDDTQDVIEDWKEAGGIGIQHKGDAREVVWQFLAVTEFDTKVLMKNEYYDQE